MQPLKPLHVLGVVAMVAATATMASGCKKPPPDDDSPSVPVRAAAHRTCADPDSLECNVAHLDDADSKARTHAIEGAAAQWDKVATKGEADKKTFRDLSVLPLTRAYGAPALKDDAPGRQKILGVLAATQDPRAKPALMAAISAYRPELGEDDARAATRAVIALCTDPAFKASDDVARPILEALALVDWAKPGSAKLGEDLATALIALRAPSTAASMLLVALRPNDGDELRPDTKSLASYQKAALRVLGVVGDALAATQLVAQMMNDGGTMTYRTDPITGNEIYRSSALESELVSAMQQAIGSIGQPSVSTLAPYALDDTSIYSVLDMQDIYSSFIDESGKAAPKRYVEIAAQTLALVDHDDVGGALSAKVSDKATSDVDRDRLLTILEAQPASKTVMDAYTTGFALLSSPKLRAAHAAAAIRLGAPTMVDWLLSVAKDTRSDADTKRAALNSAQYVATKEKIEDVGKAFDKALLARRDVDFKAIEPTATECDASKLAGADKDKCLVDPVTKKTVVWAEASPTYQDELTTITDLLTKCDKSSSCYLDEAMTAAGILDKRTTPLDGASAKVMITRDKALNMLGALGSEDDLARLATFAGTLKDPRARTFARRAIDHGLAAGSTKVADAIEAQLRDEWIGSDANAMRDASEWQPLACHLRARTGKK